MRKRVTIVQKCQKNNRKYKQDLASVTAAKRIIREDKQ